MKGSSKKSKRIAILGFGTEGKAALKFLKSAEEFAGAKIEILDKKLNKDYLKHLQNYDLIVRSPGVYINFPEIKKALKKGVKFTSLTQLFFEHAKGLVIGVTGTKGKGTTSTLIYNILKAAKKDAYLAGNIGKPAVEILKQLGDKSISVLELSSFQLQHLPHSPHIAVVLDIFPDHMDVHQGMPEYVEAKRNISKWQSANGKAFYIQGSRLSKKVASGGKGRKIAVSEKELARFGKRELLHIPGPHNYKNAAIAAAVARYLKVPENVIEKTLRNYRGLEHRLELVRRIGNVHIYNDSGSTNPQTSAAAVRAFPEAKILIVGGKDKNLDYKPLAEALKHSNSRLVVLFGENKQKIGQTISKSGIPMVYKTTLLDAIKTALQAAEKIHEKAAIVFSPGSTSFDMFSNYKERGKKFKELVRKI